MSRAIKILITPLLALGLMACGASKVPSSADLGSRGAPGTGVDGKLMAECNASSHTGMAMDASVATYYNPANGQYIANQIQMLMTRVPTEVITSEDVYLRFFRWTVDESGARQVNTLPIQMYFVQRGTGALSNSQPVDTISSTTLSEIISDRNLNNFGITLSNFLTNHIMVMVGMDIQWDALTVAYYDSSQGTQAVHTHDILLPPFYADPNTYSSVNNFPILYALHPNYSIRNSGASDQDFYQRTEQLCSNFFNAFSRVPSSVTEEPGVFQKISNFFSGIFETIKSWFQ